jgi:hypothetical protein
VDKCAVSLFINNDQGGSQAQLCDCEGVQPLTYLAGIDVFASAIVTISSKHTRIDKHGVTVVTDVH